MILVTSKTLGFLCFFLFICVFVLMNSTFYDKTTRSAKCSRKFFEYGTTQRNLQIHEITNANCVNCETETFPMQNETQWIKYGEEDTDWALLVNTLTCVERDNDTHKKLVIYSSKNFYLNNVGDQ